MEEGIKGTDWERIIQEWEQILEVDASPIIVYLFQKGVLTDSENETVKKIAVNSERMDYLMMLIKEKHKKYGAFGHFIDALKKDICTKHLAEGIMAFKPRSDPTVTSKPKYQSFEGKVREVLISNFVNYKGKSTPVSEIRDLLKMRKVFAGGDEWSNKILFKFITKTFTGVTVETNCLNIKYVMNLGKVEGATTATEELKETPKRKDLREMTISELKEFLKSYLEKNDLPVDVINSIEDQHISGKTFATMTEADIKDILPTATFGVRRSLFGLITEANVKTVNFKKDTLRHFNRPVQHTINYTKGNIVDTFINAQGKMTETIRNFHLVDNTNKDKALEFIASNIVPFISACLNGRRNGTIYFGISPKSDVTFRQGEIVGVNLLQDEVNRVLLESLKCSSIQDQQSIIKNTVKDVNFVPVLCDESNVFVLELDIAPSTIAFNDNNITIKTKTKQFSPTKKDEGKDFCVFMFSDEGFPKELLAEELSQHEKNNKTMFQLRSEEENLVHCQPKQNPRLKLQNLLTGGRSQIQDATFTFLLTDSLSDEMRSEDTLTWVSFIQNLNPRVVFDFDEYSASSGLLKKCEDHFKSMTRIITTNDFEDTIKNADYEQFLSTLRDESQIRWMFSNGYKELAIPSMDQLNWNTDRSTAFLKALNFFINNYEKDRIIFIIILFSDKYTCLIEACEEVLKKLPKKWILLAEKVDAAKIWQKELIDRKKASRHDIEEKCVLGLSWEKINKIICSLTHENSDYHDLYCEIPSSNGTFAIISDETKNQWVDIEVLSSHDLVLNIPLEKRNSESKKVQENFYSGHEVDWLNFCFPDQVRKRRQHSDVLQNVRKELSHCGNVEEEEVHIIKIIHQPGAGGTTFAKQVLWDLRCEFRCCVVLRYTELTSNYIYELWRFEDENPKPVLILVDNEEHFTDLEESIRKIEKSEHESKKFNCVIIQCIREPTIPNTIGVNEVALHQELTTDEQDWFKSKYSTLKKSFADNKKDNKDPDFLLAFNILKENFNEEFINKVVKNFTESINRNDDVEKTLLKFISFLNTHDPKFSSIPVSCFDKLLKKHFAEAQRFSNSNITVNWDETLSDSLKVLLNLSKRGKKDGGNKYIRVCSNIIAEKILTFVKEDTKETDSAIMHELLDDKLFKPATHDATKLLKVIENIFKNREEDTSINFRRKFSNFIYLVDSNGKNYEIVARLLEQLYYCNSDPYTAQLIARYYINNKKWEKAEKYARIAIDRFINLMEIDLTYQNKSQSFFWDTLGQVFKYQITLHNRNETGIPIEIKQIETVAHDIIKLAMEGCKAFIEGQSFMERKINFAVYFNEIRIVLFLLTALSRYIDIYILQRYLIDPGYNPSELTFLTYDESCFLKKLESHSRKVVLFLDDHLLEQETSKLAESNKKELVKLKASLFYFFLEPSTNNPSLYQGRQCCDYRLRHAMFLGANSFKSVLALKLEGSEGSKKKLMQIFDLIHLNLKSEHRNLEDVNVMLRILTVFVLERRLLREIAEIPFDDILKWTKELYEKEKAKTGKISHLEIYLYYVTFNFPTPDRSSKNLVFEADLSKAIQEWGQASKKFQNWKETTVLFLGIGRPPEDILFFDKSTVLKMYNNIECEHNPKFISGLRILNGMLNEGGRSIKVNTPLRLLNIPTAYKVNRKDMFQKKVFFYIGFSFSGPRAYGMCSTYPHFYKPIVNPSPQPLILENKQKSNSVEHLINQLFLNSDLQGKKVSADEINKLKMEQQNIILKFQNMIEE